MYFLDTSIHSCITQMEIRMLPQELGTEYNVVYSKEGGKLQKYTCE